MSARVRGAGSGRRRVRLGVGSLLAAVVIALLPLPEGADRARAATDDAATSSAVTKSGTKGKYDDFSGLKVTVHQTRGLRWQGVKVSWTGGAPVKDNYNFLQVMQCWGDDPDKGPDRSQCEFGNEAKIPLGTGRVVGTGSYADPEEAATRDTVVGRSGLRFVPFRSVTGETTEDVSDNTYFSSEDTNSQSWLPNDGNGSGETVFELKSASEAEYLGCGARTTAGGEIQPCWLVVVPRGTHEPDGAVSPPRAALTSALSKTNWDQRIVFPLGFEPVGENCDPDKPERLIMGSELATDAVTSWQAALCRTGSRRFTYSQQSEPESRNILMSPGSSSAGLAMTVDPVVPAEGASPVVHAPVAVSGLSISFVWMYEKGSLNYQRLDHVRLNQRLLAKALTQSYGSSLVYSADAMPAYLGDNPRYIAGDPEFKRLNPGFEGVDNNSPISLVVTAENSDSATMLWKYIMADPDAKKFLAGQKDPWGMRLNPEYSESGVLADGLDHYPMTDLTPTQVVCGYATDGQTMRRTGQEVSPYAQDMHEAAVKIRRGDIGTAYECSLNGQLTSWVKVGRPAPVQQRQAGVVDVASAARYQLGTAALPNADGEFVRPTEAALLKAVARMPDSEVAGVRTADPARMKDGAYPLTAVVYAAATLDQAEDARQDYARVIRYAAGDGQTRGTASGELPAGYAPLPAALRQQAEQAADRLEKGVPDAADPPASAAGGSDGGSGGGGGGTGSGAGSTGSGGLSGGGSGGQDTGNTPAGAEASGGSPVAARETDPAKRNVAQSGGVTPAEVLGLIRWVLLGVLIAGGVAGLAGPVMMRLSARGAVSGG